MFVGLEWLRHDAFQPFTQGVYWLEHGWKVSLAQPFQPYKSPQVSAIRFMSRFRREPHKSSTHCSEDPTKQFP
jgi:hypothetical protein